MSFIWFKFLMLLTRFAVFRCFKSSLKFVLELQLLYYWWSFVKANFQQQSVTSVISSISNLAPNSFTSWRNWNARRLCFIFFHHFEVLCSVFACYYLLNSYLTSWKLSLLLQSHSKTYLHWWLEYLLGYWDLVHCWYDFSESDDPQYRPRLSHCYS